MNDLTLEALARRVEALERALRLNSSGTRPRDWRRVVGLFGDSELAREVDAAGQAIRAAEREEARRAESAE